MPTLIRLFICFVIMLSSCKIGTDEKREFEEKKVYESLIPKVIDSNHKYGNNKTVIIIDSTALVKYAVGNYEDAITFIENDVKDNNNLSLIKGLLELNHSKSYLELGKYNLGSNFVFVSSGEWKGDFNDALGVILISRVFFDIGYNSGVFYYSWVCPGDCGADYFVFIKKDNNLWIIEDFISLSLS